MSEAAASPALSSIPPSEDPGSAQSITAWGTVMDVAVCEQCHRRFLLHHGAPVPTCPACCKGKLAVLPGRLPDRANTAAPELMLPYTVSDSTLYQSIQNFCAGVPFAPGALKPAALAARLTRLYLPMWLVDANVFAFWQAEAGFDYQVISHQEVYDDRVQGWLSKEIKEPRVRWENRVGRLKRTYQNVSVPAVEDAPLLEKKIGSFYQEDARTYSPEELGPCIVRLPDISRKDSWSEAASALQKTAAGECRQACCADRMREFRWKGQFSRQNWTLMLMPVYATSYQDDNGSIHPILIHGQTGKIAGKRRASIKRAVNDSLLIFGAGLLIFLMGLLMEFVFPDMTRLMTALSTYVLMLGFICILASSAPYLVAWDFNRKQDIEEKKLR